MLKKSVYFLLISFLFINCKKEEPEVLSSLTYADVINQEFTGDLAYETTSFVEKLER